LYEKSAPEQISKLGPASPSSLRFVFFVVAALAVVHLLRVDVVLLQDLGLVGKLLALGEDVAELPSLGSIL
jgi:hypothetical protein